MTEPSGPGCPYSAEKHAVDPAPARHLAIEFRETASRWRLTPKPVATDSRLTSKRTDRPPPRGYQGSRTGYYQPNGCFAPSRG